MAHLLDDCAFTSELWDKGAHLFRRSDRKRGQPESSIHQWGEDPFSNPILNRLWCTYPTFLVWCVWKERNRRIFELKSKSIHDIWGRICSLMIESLKLQVWNEQDLKAPPPETIILLNWGITSLPFSLQPNRSLPPETPSPEIWTLPNTGFIKLNFDGASKGNLGQEGYGGVFRNSLGQALGIFHGFIGQESNNAAELEGLLHGLQLAHLNDWFPLIIEGDSKIILKFAMSIQNGQAASKVSTHWRLEGRLEYLGCMMKSPEACSWSHVCQKGNKVADRLANLGVAAKLHF